MTKTFRKDAERCRKRGYDMELLKTARVETGAEIRVPLFIEEGEIVEVDSRDGRYLGRVK